MAGFDLFAFYRLLLGILVVVYGTVRLITFIWRWGGPGSDARFGVPLLKRYLATLLLRTRIRWFLRECFVIGGLSAVVLLLLWLHR